MDIKFSKFFFQQWTIFQNAYLPLFQSLAYKLITDDKFWDRCNKNHDKNFTFQYKTKIDKKDRISRNRFQFEITGIMFTNYGIYLPDFSTVHKQKENRQYGIEKFME